MSQDLKAEKIKVFFRRGLYWQKSKCGIFRGFYIYRKISLRGGGNKLKERS